MWLSGVKCRWNREKARSFRISSGRVYNQQRPLLISAAYGDIIGSARCVPFSLSVLRICTLVPLTPLCSEQKTHPICSECLIILRKQKGGCCLNTHPSKLSEFIGTLIKWSKYGLFCYLARKILRPA